MKHLSSVLLLSAVAALGDRSFAQGNFGPWTVPGSGIALFVSVNGSDTANSGFTRGSPFATIQHALTVADQTFTSLIPVTINVLPGTYSITTPINVPAFGIALEALDDGSLIPPTWTLSGNTSVDVIDVPSLFGPSATSPNLSLPPSIILGFDIQHGVNGIHVFPPPNAGTPLTTRLEIRDCEIHLNQTGILVTTVAGQRSEAVIEHNRIHDNFLGPGIGVELDNAGVSSCLVRANRIWDNPTNVLLNNSAGDALLSQDRLFSNFIEQGNIGIRMNNSAARIASNTIAFATGGLSPVGINYKNTAPNGILVLLNNIIWNPGVVDIVMSGINFTTFVFNNDIEDVVNPFAGTNGNFTLTPPFVGGAAPENLHITKVLTSPAIWGGANTTFVNAASNGSVPFPAAMTMSVAGSNVRIDIPIDVDTDPRVLQAVGEPAFTPDLGADEISEVALAFLAASPVTLGFDQLGNMTPQASGTGLGTLTITHPAGASAVLAMGPLFAASPVDTNSILAPVGNVLLELNSSVVFVPPSSTTGTSSTFSLTLGGASGMPEAEIFLQAIVTPAGGAFLGSGWFSNRLRMEIDN